MIRRASRNLGVTPTQAQKLQYIANNLGLPGIGGMQGSTVTIFDTVPITTGAGRQTLNFFVNTSNKSRTFSNLQTGTLNAGEAMVVEEVSFIALTLSGVDLTSDATAITEAVPLQVVPNAIIPNQAALTLGMLNITIANSKVVKDCSIFETDPAFNPRTTGIAAFDTATATVVRTGESKIYLEAPPVLPPNQKIQVTLEVSPTGAVAANTFIMCVLGRFGSIFAAKTTL